MEKNFDDFASMMQYRFPVDAKKIAEASEIVGQPLSQESLGAALAVTLYLLRQYHEWMNEEFH